MSAASKATLAFTSLSAIAIIVSVHYGQKAERAVCNPIALRSGHADVLQAMHAGVLRDMERQQQMKDRQLDFDMQRALEAEYKKIQSVHDTTDATNT